jgi:surface carbohydrate biosynthesis protein
MEDIGALFLVEHIDRELDVVTCLMQKLESKFGVTSVARNYYRDFKRSLATLNPKVVVFPFFYNADHYELVEYVTKWPLARLVNLGWEQILNKLDVDMKTPRDDVSRDRVSHICWTLEHQSFLANNGVARKNIIIAGNPVMKLYDSPYKSYFKTREQLANIHHLDVTKKWVLFPESYQFAFFSEGIINFLIRDQNANPAFLYEVKGYSERSLEQLLAWTGDLKDDIIFILRPRPSTTQDQMMNFMQRTVRNPNPNLKIIRAETVRDWILAADQVISSHSTTLVEAALAGKPIYRFSPEDYPEALTLPWHDLVPLLRDRKKFFSAINSDRDVSDTGKPLAGWARTQFLFAGDPLDAIAEWIARLWSTVQHAQPTSAAQQPPPGQYEGDTDYLGAAHDIFDDEEVARRQSRWKGLLQQAGSDVPNLVR